MKLYGMPYMGSKTAIAEDIIDILPKGKRFVDLFGGGFAMTHCALLSGKYEKFLYNEINPLIVDTAKRAISGEFNISKNPPKWISRDDFKKLKDVDGYIKTCWSFGNKGANYLYGEEIEPWKKALHYARIFGDCSLFEKMGIHTDGTRQDIAKNAEKYKDLYIKWYVKEQLKQGDGLDLDKEIRNVKENLVKTKEELRLYLVNALKESGLKASDVDRRLDTQMSVHYFGRSQWGFPTREEYNKMREFMPLSQNYEQIIGIYNLRKSLQRLESLESLEGLESLQRLQRLQSLQSLQRLQSLELVCGSYLEYEYKEGDVVYCDPPYEGTAGYNDDVVQGKETFYSDKAKRTYIKTIQSSFNHKEFYDWVATRPYQVFFSSYAITDNRFFKVWEKSKLVLLLGKKKSYKMETIYSNKPYKWLLI